MSEIGAKMRKGGTFMIRACFGSVWNHPFVVAMLCFLLLLYKSFPFVFSLVVSVSPVFICTALLLGTLLSFGQVNLPDIEIESKSLHDSASLKSGVSVDESIGVGNGNRYVESRDGTDKSSDERSELSEINTLIGTASLIKERSVEKEKAEWYDGRLRDDDIVENHYSSINRDKSAESDDERSESGSFDSEKVNVDTLDSPPGSPFKRVDETENKEEEKEDDDDGTDDEGSGSETDQAESSSPDASMSDILPMIDELHPLLDEEAPLAVNASENGSDAVSQCSSKSSSNDSRESEEQTENEEDSEVGEDDNEDGEVVVEGNKDEQIKAAIKWTKEDEKNLMDLGSSEIERNQRLENLILRRRARKNLSMLPERNLIDFESMDFPFNVAAISTTRRNPFDSSYDDNFGLPPIPGSAPVVLQRRNPFDIPYDSSEEKPNLVGDGLKEEFTTFQSKEPFFRRHERSNVGPSIFAPGRVDMKLRPFFVPEQMVPEDSSYMPIQRQSSDLSESKVSSVSETESLGSVTDLEERKLTDDDKGPELKSLSSTKSVTEENLIEESGPSSIKEHITEDELQESVTVSNIEHVSEIVGHGSQSSSSEEETLEREANDQSSSSLSEQSERVFTETQEIGRNVYAEEPGLSSQTSEMHDLEIASTVDSDIPVRDPVYDSSPQASDMHAELDLPPVLVKKMVPFVERESEVSSSSGEMEEISNIEMLTESSSSAHIVDEPASRIIDIIDERANDNLNSSVSESSIKASVEEIVIGQHSQREVPSLTSGENLVNSSEEIIERGQSPNSDSDVYVEAYDKFSLTPCAGGKAVSFFSDKQMHQPTLTHHNEVQKRDAFTESSNGVPSIKESNMLDPQEIPSVVNPPLSPDMTLVPPTADEASARPDVHTVVEETDEIKEMIDEGFLSELDSIGDFSVRCIDTVGESSSLENHAETRITTAIDVDSVDIAESSTRSMNSRETKDMHEEVLNDRDGQDSLHQSSPYDDAPTLRNEDRSVHPVSNLRYEDDVYWTPKTDANSFFKRTESAILEPPRAELVIQETITEHENSAVLQPTQAKSVTEETVTEHSEGRTEQLNSVVPIEDASLDKQVDDRSLEHHEFPNSADDDVHVVEPRDIHETTVEHIAEPISSEGTSVHLDREVKSLDDVSHSGTSHKGKGKSKPSRSNSSSSSDSSSSDSD